MKKLYILLMACLIVYFSQAQNQNPFDQRNVKIKIPFVHDAAIEKAVVTDGRQSNSKQDFLLQAGTFIKPFINNNREFIVRLATDGATPVVIYRKDGSSSQAKTSIGINEACYSFLNEVHDIMRIKTPEIEFAISEIIHDD